METLILKNGAEEAKPMVLVTMMILRDLADKMKEMDLLSSLMLWDLGTYCQDGTEPFHGDKLVKLGLMDGERGSYSMHDSTKNIISCALTVEGDKITLGSPVKPPEKDERSEGDRLLEFFKGN